MRCRREAPVAVRGAMGLVYVAMGVAREGGPEQTVRFLIDSGAAYSVLPWRVWRALGLKPKRRLEFTLADGTIIRLRLSDCRLSYQHIDVPGPVCLGQRTDFEQIIICMLVC